MSDTPNGGPVVAAPAKKRPMSFTAIDTYTRCPGFYETRYVQRRKFPASDAQLLGTVVHAAAELYANQRGEVTPAQAFDTVVAREVVCLHDLYALPAATTPRVLHSRTQPRFERWSISERAEVSSICLRRACYRLLARRPLRDRDTLGC